MFRLIVQDNDREVVTALFPSGMRSSRTQSDFGFGESDPFEELVPDEAPLDEALESVDFDSPLGGVCEALSASADFL